METSLLLNIKDKKGTVMLNTGDLHYTAEDVVCD
jgi:hypothetical protein